MTTRQSAMRIHLQRCSKGIADNVSACRYPTKFLFELPAHPTAVACSRFLEAGGGVEGLAAATGLVLRDQAKAVDACIATNLSEWWAFNPGFIPGAWTFQRCTEILIPVEVGEDNPMFLPCNSTSLPGNCWANGSELAAFCQRRFPEAGTFNPERVVEQRVFARVSHQGLAAFEVRNGCTAVKNGLITRSHGIQNRTLDIFYSRTVVETRGVLRAVSTTTASPAALRCNLSPFLVEHITLI